MQPALTTQTKRIESIDLLKGLVMVVMALDHVRDYFHFSANYFDPADPTQTTLPIFFTRWITHFCAPTFSFLAGASAFLVGRRKTKAALSGFLWKRGLWLVIIEMTVVSFAWFFDVQFRTIGMLTIWSLGISMIVLAALVHLPKNFILAFSLVLIFGHNVLDGVQFNGSLLWDIVHHQNFYPLNEHTQLMIGYPVVPWIAVMSLGYYFGSFYDQKYDPAKRKRLFNIIGVLAIALFVFLRFTNLYGNPADRGHFGSFTKNLISFLNPAKYPPSLMYLLMTLGGALLFLANTENLRGKIVQFFSTFGRVPFFYYILHLYVIHLLALLFAQVSGFGWQHLILPSWISFIPLKGYGVGLAAVYLIWIAVILLLYPLCKKFDRYKQAHKEKWWLSYL